MLSFALCSDSSSLRIKTQPPPDGGRSDLSGSQRQWDEQRRKIMPPPQRWEWLHQSPGGQSRYHFCLYGERIWLCDSTSAVGLLFPVFLHSLQASQSSITSYCQRQSLENSCDEKLRLCSSLCKLLKIFKKLPYFYFSKVCPHSTNMYDRRAQAKGLTEFQSGAVIGYDHWTSQLVKHPSVVASAKLERSDA